MKISCAYKLELKINNKQRTLLSKHAGTARFTWNWGLAQRIELYSTSKQSTDAMKQHKVLNALKKSDFPWMYEVSKCAAQEALRDLDRAYKNFFRKNKKSNKSNKSNKFGFPKFKKKGRNESFRLTGTIKLYKNHIQLQRNPGIKSINPNFISNN